MAGSVNKVILIGNLGADPEVRRTQDGKPIVNLRVATSDTWRDKATRERRERKERQRAANISARLAKDKYSTEVVLQGFNSVLTMLDKAGGGAEPSYESGGNDFGSSGPAPRERKPAMAGAGGGARADMDDEIPF